MTSPQGCRFAQVTDLHLSLGPTAYGPNGDATMWIADGMVHERVVTTPGVLAELFEEITRVDPGLDFIVATGDLTNTGTDEELAAYAEVVRAAPVRIVSIPGNHDHYGDAGAYERHVGPRWFSFDHGGVHFAAIDWFTHRLGFDTAIQDEWLAADLALVDTRVPVVLLTHDQMPAEFFARLPRQPVATFSGHWHTTRVVAHAGTLHVNTGTATFAGLDYSPPQYRTVTVDGADGGVRMRTVVRGSPNDGATARLGARPAARRGGWVAATGGGGHRAGAEVVGDLVIVAGKSEDEAAGSVVALDATSGGERWSRPLDAAVKATPRSAGDAVFACTVAGDVVCIDAASGDVRWSTALHPDPLYLWCYLRPAVHDGLVFAGDVGRFAALDVATGAVRWQRDDLGSRENLTTVVDPVVVDGLLLGGFAAQSPPLWAVDPASGVTRWPDGDAHCIYAEGNLATELPRVVMGGITPDPDGTDFYVVRLGSQVERVRAADGAVVWTAPFHGWFNPAPPVVAGDAVVVSASTGVMRCYERSSGAVRWTTTVVDRSPVAMGSYRCGGASMLAPALSDGDRVLQPDGDSGIAVVDLATGSVLDTIAIGVPVVAPLAFAGDSVVAVGIDGWVRALPAR